MGNLTTLCNVEGYTDLNELMADLMADSCSPGICRNKGCAYTTEVEPDSNSGYCEECETNTVVSAHMLLGVI